eukprot:scaffold422659_cov59-Attheya_sp.AAC.1
MGPRCKVKLQEARTGCWKTDKQCVGAYVHHKVSKRVFSSEKASAALRGPTFDTIPVPSKEVKPVPRLLWDVRALCEMFKCTTPPKVCVRSKLVLYVLKQYGFVDASGCGVGGTITTPKVIKLQEGIGVATQWRSHQIGESIRI